jgi:hypothetical protein
VILVPDTDQVIDRPSYLPVTIDSSEVESLVRVTAVSSVICVDTNAVPVSVTEAETTKN